MPSLTTIKETPLLDHPTTPPSHSPTNLSTPLNKIPNTTMFSSSNSLLSTQANPTNNPNFSTIPKTKTNPFHIFPYITKPRSRFSIHCNIRELRERINTIKNTQKITEAMKLVSAAKVRRAQEAVIRTRPLSEALADMLYHINAVAQLEDIDVPLTNVRFVKKVALVVITGDRGLCGGFNNAVIRLAEARIGELKKLGVECCVISVGKKGNGYFFRRMSDFNVESFVEGDGFPTAKEAQVIADDVFSMFVTEEVDKVEVLYTKFVSLIRSNPVIHTLLPLSPNEDSVDVLEDELFRLTTKEGKLSVIREKVGKKKDEMLQLLEFEQDPAQILDALMPLYLNSQILRALQESVASELAARMNAMSSATDNAVELRNNLSMAYNRERQTKITEEILEIVAGGYRCC